MMITSEAVFTVAGIFGLFSLLSAVYTILKVGLNRSLGVEVHVLLVSSFLTLGIMLTFVMAAVSGLMRAYIRF